MHEHMYVCECIRVGVVCVSVYVYVCGLIRIQGNIMVIHVYSRRQKKVPVPFPFPFRFRSIPILFRSTTVQRNVLPTVRVPFCFVMDSVKESSAVFIDCTKQFFYSHKTCTMLQLNEKEGMTASEAKLGHLMMQRGVDEARRPGGGTQTQCHTQNSSSLAVYSLCRSNFSQFR